MSGNRFKYNYFRVITVLKEKNRQSDSIENLKASNKNQSDDAKKRN